MFSLLQNFKLIKNFQCGDVNFSKSFSQCKSSKPQKLTIEKINFASQRVLMRVDFNVPMKDGKITNNQRIAAALPSIQYILQKNAKSVVLMSHLGRPNGRRNMKFTMAPVAKELEKLLKQKVIFLDDCVGQEVEEVCADPKPGSVILLENVRFYAEETGCTVDENKKEIRADPLSVKAFRACLSRFGDIFINDAFGTSHRPHSSMMGEGIKTRGAGFLLMKELKEFDKVINNPRKPFLAILGGAKVADKIPLIMNLLNSVTDMIVGGGMAFTLLKINDNMEIGKSLFDEKGSKLVKDIMQKAKEKNVNIVLPADFLCAKKVDKDPGETKIVTIKEGVPNEFMGLDVGPKSFDLFRKTITAAKTIVWNGPPGIFELEVFAKGTRAMLDAVVEATGKGATTIVGGGDTATACIHFGAAKKVTHVSTGGGASLELLEGKVLPAIAALTDAE